jgi:cytochrome c oxidase cbb3-type subunit III
LPSAALAVLAVLASGACDSTPSSTASSVTPSGRATPAAATAAAASVAAPAAQAPLPLPAPVTAPPSAEAIAGEKLFGKYCALCHGPEAKGYAADNAPSLVTDSFLRSASDDFIAQGITLGRPGTPMAPYGARYGGPLTDEQVRQIVAFIRSKGPFAEVLSAVAEGSAEGGKPLFSALCASCHGDGPRRSAPRLDLPSFLHIATNSFLDYAIRKGRAGTTMESYAGRLNQSQINDIIAYLRTFQNATPAQQLPGPTGKEPMVVNPKGKQADFSLREDRFVSAADVAAAVAAKRRLVILDARATSDWMLGHIPGAISMPYYEMKRIDEVPKDGTWVLAYCACPHHASGEVVDALRKLGYPKTAVIDEGVTFWKQKGYPMAMPPPVEGQKPVQPVIDASGKPTLPGMPPVVNPSGVPTSTAPPGGKGKPSPKQKPIAQPRPIAQPKPAAP